MRTDLSGRTALVTGASSGLGRQFAFTLAESGAAVIVAARRHAELQDLVDQIKAAGGSAEARVLDVTDIEAVTKAFKGLTSVDIVVNNAGVAGASPALECTADEWRWTYDINVHGAWFVAQQAAKKMVATGVGGSIINIASITGERPGGSTAAYASSKAAVIHMTKALAMEWARYGVRVNALAPGYFSTDLNRDFLASDYGRPCSSGSRNGASGTSAIWTGRCSC
jgi:NAD(P)-dependent dehydrogenase (short-subunit alcohol dehydrogenase family)